MAAEAHESRIGRKFLPRDTAGEQFVSLDATILSVSHYYVCLWHASGYKRISRYCYDKQRPTTIKMIPVVSIQSIKLMGYQLGVLTVYT